MVVDSAADGSVESVAVVELTVEVVHVPEAIDHEWEEHAMDTEALLDCLVVVVENG